MASEQSVAHWRCQVVRAGRWGNGKQAILLFLDTGSRRRQIGQRNGDGLAGQVADQSGAGGVIDLVDRNDMVAAAAPHRRHGPVR